MTGRDDLLTAIALIRSRKTRKTEAEAVEDLRALLSEEAGALLASPDGGDELLGVISNLVALGGRMAARLEESGGGDYLDAIARAVYDGKG